MNRQEASWPPAIGEPDRAARPGSSSRSTSSTRQAPPDLRHGPHQPREQRARSPATASPSCCRATTRSPAARSPACSRHGAVPVPVAALLVHRAAARTTLLADKGDLWAFVSDTPGVKNYYDVLPDRAPSVTGHFIKVPKDIATGRNADGSELKAADKGLPAAADQRQLADRPSLHRAGRHRRPAVGARVLERHQQRVPVRARRGHRLRQAARHEQRRLHRRLGPRPDRRPRASTRRTSGPRTAASGRWCSTRTTRRR